MKTTICPKCKSRDIETVHWPMIPANAAAAHYMCRQCGAHYYRCQWWTRDEWARWRNNG